MCFLFSSSPQESHSTWQMIHMQSCRHNKINTSIDLASSTRQELNLFVLAKTVGQQSTEGGMAYLVGGGSAVGGFKEQRSLRGRWGAADGITLLDSGAMNRYFDPAWHGFKHVQLQQKWLPRAAEMTSERSIIIVIRTDRTKKNRVDPADSVLSLVWQGFKHIQLL